MLRRVRQTLWQVLFLMARRPDLVCGVLTLGVLLTLAVKSKFSRAKNVVAPARPPVRFFSTEAPVVDLYLGQLDQVERLRSVAEVSLIFFYAPWCAHSMAARQEVQQVAKKLAKQVQFVAVNCWWSQGKCRRRNRFYQYPTIHLFYRRFGPIEYKGPFVAPYVESFILRVVTPLIYLPSRSTLQEFLSYHESRVVGFFQFNASPQPPGYVTYLSSALQALKRDFNGVVRFGVVTNRHVAEAIAVEEDETVYLHRRFNSSLIFPRRERNFTSEAICSWVFEHHETVLQWLQPPGTKSHLLEEELNKGPALLLFLPHDPLGSNPSPELQQIADIAVRYHSCENANHSSSDKSGSSPSHRLCCQSVVFPESTTTACDICLDVSGLGVPSSSARCSFLSTSQGAVIFHSHLLHQLFMRQKTETSVTCGSFLSSYSPFSQYSACCAKRQLSEQSSQAKEVPDVLPSSNIPSTSAAHPQGGGVTGLRCQTNKTLRFFLLDTALTWPLAVRLGARDNTSASHQLDPEAQGEGSGRGSFAAIVNLKDEVHYVLHRSPATTLTESLETFIRNFSAPYSLLQRHLVGDEDRTQGGEEDGHTPPRPLIKELSTSSFLHSIMDPQKDVLLFYYTHWCGFCSVLNHIIIQLARLLQGNSSITVTRVNVAQNDLPWEFMVDHVPTVLLLPRYRKHLSVKFPDNLPITLPNLLRFLLQHSSSVHDAEQPVMASGRAEGPGPSKVFHAQFLELQREVQTLHQAREHLSQQLAQLWRENRRLKFDTHTLEAENAVLQRERQSLETQHRETSRQLGEAVRRLQELADASESLLRENTLLRILLRMLKDRTEVKEQEELEEDDTELDTNHVAS
ncbi:thioredoxin domain-containing protein 11 [Thalassophryne amazonica]|uniref:thioredoxin domain-containing protein 11 n=1 Tax=Thalassophryne amazonica TaxID=390379 RepID=UPI001472208B|nr:thioredoxin domain-containing protein 11 [Thalassophryne amazonica]